jgi:hypothetical protein
LVGQELLACDFNVLSALNFWVREKTISTADLDYLVTYEGMYESPKAIAIFFMLAIY